MTSQEMADIMAQAIDLAMAPITTRLAVAEARLAAYDMASRKDVGGLVESVASLRTKVAELEARPPAVMEGPPGPPGPAGPQGDAGVPGKDGSPGRDGVDGVQGPQGEKGLDGVNGKDGAPGAVGQKGADGINGKDGQPGADGQKGLDGTDGIGLADALIDREGRLVLTMSNGSTKAIGTVAGKDGAPGAAGRDADDAGIIDRLSKQIDSWDRPTNGKDGRDGIDGKDGTDGLGVDDLDLVFDESKGYRLVWSNGAKSIQRSLAVPFHAGVWMDGRSYVTGACVTAKGSTWIALAATKGAVPGAATEESRVWRLAVKRGADGKPGKDGKRGGDDE
jgi:integrin beta 3